MIKSNLQYKLSTLAESVTLLLLPNHLMVLSVVPTSTAVSYRHLCDRMAL
jgi:inner membrane protein involved in colicin E2 resistance